MLSACFYVVKQKVRDPFLSPVFFSIFSEQGPGNDQLFYFFRPLVNLNDLGVPIETLDVLVADEPIPSVELEGFVRDPHRRLSGKPFCHGDRRGVDPSLIEEPGGLLVEIATCLDPDGHFSDLESAGLKRGEGFSELAPLSDILNGLLHGPLSQSDRL